MRWRQDYYLFLIGAAAFTAATIGYQHRRRHLAGDTGHVAGMGIAYVAMLTAFYVDNGPHLPLWDRLPAFAFWLLPSAIGAPVIIRDILGARHAHGPPRTRQERQTASRNADACPATAASGAGVHGSGRPAGRDSSADMRSSAVGTSQ